MMKKSFTVNWVLGMCLKENFSDSPSNEYSRHYSAEYLFCDVDMNSKSGEEQKKGHHVRKSPNFDSKSGAEQKKVKMIMLQCLVEYQLILGFG